MSGVKGGHAPSLSVLIPVYNVAERIQSCFDSLKSQDLQSAEFIFVDDGSTDGSGKLCDDFAQGEPRAKVIHFEQNKGTLLARKECLAQAIGRYCTWIDPDDYYTSPKSLSFLLHEAEKNDVDMLQFSVSLKGESGEEVKRMASWLKYRGPQYVKGFQNIITLLGYNKGCHLNWCVWDKIYKTSIMKKVEEQIPEIYCVSAEDALLTFITCLFVESFAHAETHPLLCYVISGGVSRGNVDINRFIKYYAAEPYLASIAESIAQRCKKDFVVQNSINFFYNALWDLALTRLKKLNIEDQDIALRALCKYNDPVIVIKKYVASINSYSYEYDPDVFIHNIKRIKKYTWRNRIALRISRLVLRFVK